MADKTPIASNRVFSTV